MKHRSDYKTCVFCGANLDIGETCDCLQEIQPPKYGKSKITDKVIYVKIYGTLDKRASNSLAI